MRKIIQKTFLTLKAAFKIIADNCLRYFSVKIRLDEMICINSHALFFYEIKYILFSAYVTATLNINLGPVVQS